MNCKDCKYYQKSQIKGKIFCGYEAKLINDTGICEHFKIKFYTNCTHNIDIKYIKNKTCKSH